ncbi:MAG: pyridoxamine 5'-phosphate oxidase [Tepidisphaerales bacterium]
MAQSVDWVDAPRVDYTVGALSESDLEPTPVKMFRKWLAGAKAWGGGGVKGWDEMVLATATPDGRPSARVVLLKAVDDDDALVFVSNRGSRKAREMEVNPWAAVTVWWQPMERQVRWEGRVERASDAVSDAYFAQRPRDAQIGAWASAQSEEIPSREALEVEVERFRREFEGRPVPRPPHWGAYRVVCERAEFWQGRPSRLHDRLVYERVPTGGWRVARLAP